MIYYKDMTTAIKKIEIEQVLNLKDPMAKLIFTLGMINLLVTLVTSAMTVNTIDLILQQLVNLLFMLFVLSCFKNGNCSVLAFVVSVLTILLFSADIILRITVPF